MYIIQLQNSIMGFQESASMNKMNYKELKKIKWRPNIILIIYFLKNIIIAYGQKIKKNRLLKRIN